MYADDHQFHVTQKCKCGPEESTRLCYRMVRWELLERIFQKVWQYDNRQE